MARTLLALAVVVLPAAVRADPLPPGAVARIGDHRFYHGPEVTVTALSPDGRRAASAAAVGEGHRHASEKDRAEYDRTVILWDAATGAQLRALKADRGPVRSLAFSPDSRLLAAVTPDGVTLFDTETGRVVRRVEHEWGDRVHFTPDGKQLRVANWLEGSLLAWDVASGKRLRKWVPPAAPSEWVKERERVREVEPSGDGRRIAWLLYVPLETPPGGLPSPLTPLASAVVVTDTETGRPLLRREFGGEELSTFAFTPDGRRFLTGGDKLRVWDAATGREERALDCPGAFRITVAPGGRRAVVAQDSGMRVWELDSGKAGPKLGGVMRASHQPFTADGNTMLVMTGSALRLFDITTGKERGPAVHRTPVVPRFSADGRSLFTTCDELRCRWDVTGATPALKDRAPRHDWEFVCTEWFQQPPVQSPDERLFLDYISGDAVRVREVATGRVVRALGASRDIHYGLFAPDAGRVLVRHSGRLDEPDVVRLYDVATGKAAGEFPTPDAVGEAVAVSPDGRLVAWVDRAYAVHLHDAATGRAVRTITRARPPTGERCDAASLLFSPDGTRLLVTDSRDFLARPGDAARWRNLPVRVVRVADGREEARFDAGPAATDRNGTLSCAAWSPDGRLLALAEEGSGVVRIVEAATGRARAELTGHRHGVRALAFAPDGRTLASGGEDTVVFVWAVPAVR